VAWEEQQKVKRQQQRQQEVHQRQQQQQQQRQQQHEGGSPALADRQLREQQVSPAGSQTLNPKPKEWVNVTTSAPRSYAVKGGG